VPPEAPVPLSYDRMFSASLSYAFLFYPTGSATFGLATDMAARKDIANAIKDHLARNRISREQFAFKTKLGKSTVDKLLIGLFSERTLSIVEEHTHLVLRAALKDGAALPATDQAVRSAVVAKPTIAVLPFAFLGGYPEQAHIADGLTEDIITALARLRWLFVIARNSTFAYRGRSVDVRQVGRELDARYVIEGSVRCVGSRIRLTAQLVEAETGKHIWAERYDRELHDIFAIQDDITSRVVAAVEPYLYDEENARIAKTPTENINAWGLTVRATGLISTVDRRQNVEAQALLARAIVVDPRYARAHALLGWAVWWATLCYWVPDRQAGYARAWSHAKDALIHDRADPWARMVSGLSLSAGGHHDRALGELKTALDLNPSFALGRMAHGWALLRAGEFDAAIGESGQALRLSPIDSFSGFYSAIHGLALLGAEKFDDALPHLRCAVAAFAEYSGHYNTLISCCGHLALTDEAREFIAVRNKIGPPLRLSVLRKNLAKFAHCDVFVAGLRKAGVPE
jgi:adenylate cyclase